jgi:hypothetical protein
MKFEDGVNKAQPLFGDIFDHKSFVFYKEEKNELWLELLLPNAHVEDMEKDPVTTEEFEEHYYNILELLKRQQFKRIVIPTPSEREFMLCKKQNDRENTNSWKIQKMKVDLPCGEQLCCVWDHHS